eukprot:m.13595 g.13595  ORF g.13595 m.13595 type:complete len:70 (+) comp10186_c0_seq1:543-752(+)
MNSRYLSYARTTTCIAATGCRRALQLVVEEAILNFSRQQLEQLATGVSVSEPSTMYHLHGIKSYKQILG